MDEPASRVLADLHALALDSTVASGARWKLAEPGRQLDANLVHLPAGRAQTPSRPPDQAGRQLSLAATANGTWLAGVGRDASGGDSCDDRRVDARSRAVTLDEVAARAGVSRSAASRVINNAPHVSRAKRAAVQRAIDELGYVPNATARALASQQSGSVVLAVSAEDPAVYADQFVAEVVVGILSVLEETDLELMLVTATSNRGQQRLEKLLRSRTTAGMMLMSMHGDDPIARLAEDAELPVVFGGRPLHFEPRYYVDADNRGGARLATEHLVETGRTRIATITGRMDEAAGTARYKGFQETLAVAGLDARRVAHGDFSEAGGQVAMETLLSEHPELDAVFVASDQMAIGALRALAAAGRSVPSDVAVVGFNDIPMARHTNPPLTTVSQPIRSLGREMARMLHAVLSGENPSPLILPTRLVIRASSR